MLLTGGLQPGEDPYSGEWGGVSHSGTCSASFPLGTAVTLHQTPDEGSYFNGGLGTEASWSWDEPSSTQTVTGEYTPVRQPSVPRRVPDLERPSPHRRVCPVVQAHRLPAATTFA